MKKNKEYTPNLFQRLFGKHYLSLIIIISIIFYYIFK